MMRKWLKGLTLRKKFHILWALLAIDCVLAVSVALFFEVVEVGLALMIFAWVFLILTLVLAFLWRRCPHCGSLLARGHKDGDYCGKCGKRVFWDNHDDFQDLEEQ